MDPFLSKTLQSTLGKIWGDVAGYLFLYDFIKLKLATASGRAVHIPSVADFWYSILGDRFAAKSTTRYRGIRDGDIVKLKDVFLTEWTPKLPGQIWTVKGVAQFAEGRQSVEGRYEFDGEVYDVLDPWGKKRVVQAGYGSVRLARTRKEDCHACLGIVGPEQWNADYAIPVVVSRSVYKQFCKYSNHGAPWLRSLEGVVRIGEDIPLAELIPRAIGAKLTLEAQSMMRHRPYLPKCFMQVTSPLSFKATFNDSHPEITAWAMYETSATLAKKKPRWHRGPERFEYTYTACSPMSRDSVQAAVEFIQWYGETHGARRFITDFDGVEPKLDAEIPIDKDPIRARKQEARRLVQRLSRWMKELTTRFD